MKEIFFIGALMIFSMHLLFSQDVENWTQFRGDGRDGQIESTNGAIQWDALNPVQNWKVEIGEGFSEVAVKNNVCYVMHSKMLDSIKGEALVSAFDATSGKELWKTKIDSIFIDVDGWGNGPRSTPALDEEKLYGLSGRGKFVALSQKDGSVVWEKDLVSEFGSSIPRWGYSSSPILLDDNVILEVGGSDNNGYVAFNKIDGSVVWTYGQGQPTYNSPLLIEKDDQKQLVSIIGGKLTALNEKGDSLWAFQLPMRTPTAIPLYVAPNKLFFSGINSIGGLMLEMDGNNIKEVFRNPTLKNDWSTSCYKDGYIYGFHVAALRCISAEDGSVKWTKRGLGKGSLIRIEDKLMVLSDHGKLVVVEANPEKYTEVTSLQAMEGKSWTAPSYANGVLYLRNLNQLVSYKLNNK